MHGTRPKPAKEDEGKVVGAILDEIADILKGGEGQRDDTGGKADAFALWFEHEQVLDQRQ